MRKFIILVTLIFSISTIVTYEQKTGLITVNTRFSGILDGYDHNNKTMVYLDGKLAGETSALLQSKPNSCILTANKGTHTIRIINMAEYEGNWEEHTLINQYSLDALYTGEINLNKEITIDLVFDISEKKTLARIE